MYNKIQKSDKEEGRDKRENERKQIIVEKLPANQIGIVSHRAARYSFVITNSVCVCALTM